MDKPFLTFDEQIERLTEKGISCESKDEKRLLIKKGYFNLVNGYKKPFIHSKLDNGAHVYYQGTSIRKIGQVLKFDRRLSNILLKNITHVEEEIRNITAYFFDLYNKDNQGTWQNGKGFDPKAEIETVNKLIKDISDEISSAKSSNNSYINHYSNKDIQIPTWVMIKVIKMTTFTKFLELTKKDVKVDICKLYHIEYNARKNDYKILFSALNWIRKTRNACAHNERIIFLEDKDQAVLTKYHILLTNAYNKRNRKKQMIDLLIYLKYFNNKTDFSKLIKAITVELGQMKEVIGEVVFERIRVGLGIRNIEHLQVISSIQKTINYDKLILLT
jgi:abortive infection bacteriophage resistance protein